MMIVKVNEKPMIEAKGLGVSPGIALGTAVRVSAGGRQVFRFPIAPTEVSREIERLEIAVHHAQDQLHSIKAKMEQALGQEHTYILDAHVLMLEDQNLINEIKSLIESHHVNAEWAVKVVTDRLMAVFAEIQDEYLRGRGSDIEDVAHRLIMALSGGEHHRRLPSDAILIAEQVLPSMMVEFDVGAIAGLVARTGGWTSHAAIIARGLGIPAVVGVETIDGSIETGARVIVDGNRGLFLVNPTDDIWQQYSQRKAEDERHWCVIRDRTQLPAETRDGVSITLRANIELPSEIEALDQYGAQGIGLFRTQYLYLQTAPELPSEQMQLEVYQRLAEASGEHGVAIRTFDWAERREWLGAAEPEPNPALGLRAIRFSLQAEDLFRTQLRAILRAACHGRVRVVLPLVSHIGELRRSRHIIEEVAEQLTAEGVECSESVAVGVMIEIPAAVMIADVLAAEADFFSLGTNDLTQYLLAVDRDNARVAHLYEPLHPAVLRAVKLSVEAAAVAGIPIEVCGEMASHPMQALMLIGLGLRSLSMAPKAIPVIKEAIRSMEAAAARDVAAQALRCDSAEEVQQILREWWRVVTASSTL
jgi:phosphotransferase system enzyme I (PtsI)